MEVLKGNKKEYLDLQALLNRKEKSGKVVVDIGTGDGGFIYKQALKFPDNLYLGLDPSEKQLKISSRAIQRKKLTNALLAVCSVENLPDELENTADLVYINFPWGSLLETIVKPIEGGVLNILKIMRAGATLSTVFGYDRSFEPSETRRLGLPSLSLEYIKNSLIPAYENLGLKIDEYGAFDTSDKKVETTWGKRLKSSDRDWFYLTMTK